MTTLTPPSAEHCALSKEIDRQFCTGELDAYYWIWEERLNDSKWLPKKNGFFHAFEYRYYPSPAHPHWETYREWQQLIDSGEAGRGWWMIDCDDGKTFNPKWHIHFAYYIVKTDKHPDNAKPALKLIDWTKVPVGCQTSQGELMDYAEPWAWVNNTKNSILLVAAVNLRLREQTTFTHLPTDTPPPVVDGLVFEYEVVSTNECRYTYTDLKNKVYRDCIAYRVIGLAPGYTDNPELAQ
jgi:hypothetical protein